MADLETLPPPPPGFELDKPLASTPPPPPGFEVATPSSSPKPTEMSEEEQLMEVTEAVAGTTFLPKITQEDRVARITQINQALEGLSADPSHPDALYRETLLRQRDAHLEEYRNQSDRELRVKGYEALSRDLPEWVVGTAGPFMREQGTELAKDIGVSAIAMKGGGAGATGGLMLSGLAGPAQPLAALVTVPTGFLLGSAAAGSGAELLLDPVQDMLAGKNEDAGSWQDKVYSMAQRGGLNGVITGALDGVFKGVHAIRRMDAGTKEKLMSTVFDTITGSSGRTAGAVSKLGEKKALQWAEDLVDDGYVQALYAWNETKTIPKAWKKLATVAKQNIKDKETIKYLDDLLERADSPKASMKDVHDAIKALHGVSLQSRLADPKLSGVKIKIDWDEVKNVGLGTGASSAQAKQAVAPGQEQSFERALGRLKKLYGNSLSLQEANALKVRGANHSKYFSSTPDSTKSLLNKQMARVIGQAMEAEIKKVDEGLAAAIQYHNKVNAAYQEMSSAVARTSAAEITNSTLQKTANLVKSPDAFAQSLLGGGITGSIAGGATGAAAGAAYGFSEGYEPLSQEMGLAVGAGLVGGSTIGGAAGGMMGSLHGAFSQTMSARLRRAKALSLARKVTSPASKALNTTAGGKLAKSMDVLRQNEAQYTMFIGLANQLFGGVGEVFADLPEEDQRAILVEVSRAVPSMFEEPTSGGLSSVVDGFIVDPEERAIAIRHLSEERKQGLVSAREYRQQVSSINLNGSIATLEPMRSVAKGLDSKPKTVDTGLGTTRKVTSEKDSAKLEVE